MKSEMEEYSGQLERTRKSGTRPKSSEVKHCDTTILEPSVDGGWID